MNFSSKYERLSRDFIYHNPLSRYIPEHFYNMNATIKSDHIINVVFLGFGHVGSALFKAMIANNQFVSEQGDRLAAKLVQYHVFDYDKCKFSAPGIIDMPANGSMCGFPLPEKLCDVSFKKLDVALPATMPLLKGLITRNSYNFIIISLGTDFRNWDLARKIESEFKGYKNITIFCRLAKGTTEDYNSVIRPIGGVDSIDDQEKINSKLFAMAQIIASIYEKTKCPGAKRIRDWESLPLFIKYLNTYLAINIRFKLNLLGFDYDFHEKGAISKEQYYLRYLAGTSGEVLKSDGTFDYDYYKQYFGLSVRNVLAYSEHLRWCAFYMLNGYRQMNPKKIVYSEKKRSYITKDALAKENCCITSYYGLDMLYNYITEKSKLEETGLMRGDIESYRYDYMACDNIHDILGKIGANIINKN